ncbi:MAG: helix-turn-helix domain-containing protein [Pseudomonadales bacterium]|nr:helix-turn-helix domain-containing protein [Pseudomonadales bacterium]
MSAVGPLLSEYRKRNRLSQLDLSLLADVSSRHISFIETGRTSPSRAMLLKLADVMNLPHKDSNLLLNSGGYAAAYTELDIESAEMEPVRQALSMILENHNPYPALVMDSSYNLLMANQAQQALMSHALGSINELSSNNIMEALFDHSLFRPLIANWDVVASHLLRRLKKQVLAYGNPGQELLYKKLLTMSPPQNWEQPDESQEDGPMLTVDFKVGDLTLSMFTTLSQFGSALDIGMEELLIESYFPANEDSQQFFSNFLN